MSEIKGSPVEAKSAAKAAPIEEAPVVIEKPKTEKKEIPEVRQKVKSQPKNQAKVILITRDGCIGEDLAKPGFNISFYGKEYLTKQIGDIIEF